MMASYDLKKHFFCVIWFSRLSVIASNDFYKKEHKMYQLFYFRSDVFDWKLYFLYKKTLVIREKIRNI